MMKQIVAILIFPLYVLVVFGALIPFVFISIFFGDNFVRMYNTLYKDYLKCWK